MGVFANWTEINGYRAESLPVIKEEMERMLQARYHRRRVAVGNQDRSYGWSGVRWRREEEQTIRHTLRAKTAPEEAAGLVARHADLATKYNEAVATLDAKGREIVQQGKTIQQQEAELTRLRRALQETKADQSWATERLQMAEQISKQNGVISRQQKRLGELQAKVRLLQGKKVVKHPSTSVGNAADHDDVENLSPAEKAELDDLLKRLGGDDDVDDDGAK